MKNNIKVAEGFNLVLSCEHDRKVLTADSTPEEIKKGLRGCEACEGSEVRINLVKAPKDLRSKASG